MTCPRYTDPDDVAVLIRTDQATGERELTCAGCGDLLQRRPEVTYWKPETYAGVFAALLTAARRHVLN